MLPKSDAQIPQIINYQGRITVGATLFTGTGQFRFALVDGAGTTTYWSNDGTSSAGSQPAAAVSLPVANGLYVVPLGDTTFPNMTSVPASVFSNSDVRLRVWFDNGSNGIQLLTPDQRITSVGYAMVAAVAEQVKEGAITQSMIAPTAAVPVGAVIAWWGSTSNIPDGFELCNGAVPTTTGATLAGNKPDLRGRFPRGSASADVKTTPVTGGLDVDAPFSTGNTFLTAAQLPPHTHSYSGTVDAGGTHIHTGTTDGEGAHTHKTDILARGASGSTGAQYGTDAGSTSRITAELGEGQFNSGGATRRTGPPTGNHSHTFTTNSGGSHNHTYAGTTDPGNVGGQGHNHAIPAHDNRPAYLELIYIIRVK